MRLLFRLQLAVFVVLGLVLAVSAWFQVQREAELFFSDTAGDNQTTAEFLAAAVGEVWTHRGDQAARDFLQSSRSALSRLDVALLPPDISPSPGAQAGLSYKEPGRADGPRQPSSGPTVLVRLLGPGRQPAVVVRAPVMVQGRSVAVLELTESLAARDAYVRSTLMYQGLLGGALLVVGGIASAMVGYTLVGRRIERLVRRARAVSDGDLQTRVNPRGRDELSQLGRELDSMCQHLSDSVLKARQATAAQMEAVEQVRRADRLALAGTLASGIAHELGTPLSVVSLRASMIISGEQDDEQSRQSAVVIREQSERMTRIIRDLLEFARPRQASRALEDVRPIVDRTVRLLQPMGRKRGIQVSIVSSDNDGPVMAEVDAGQIEQVVSNLIVNAMQAPRQASGSGIVAVAVRATERSLRLGEAPQACVALSVSDDGMGIPPALLERVFEPFVSTKPAGEGTGLGLTVCAGLVAEHGGEIVAQARPEGGTVFTVYIPASR